MTSDNFRYKSFICTIKRIGPSTLPCGTLLITLDQSEHKPLTLTLCCLFDGMSIIHFKTLTLPEIP